MVEKTPERIEYNQLLSEQYAQKLHEPAYIYALCAGGVPVYVGCTSKTIEARYASHTHLLRRGKHHCKPLQSIYDDHQGEVSVTHLETCTTDDIYTRERYWADKLRGEGHKLCNIQTLSSGRIATRKLAERRAKEWRRAHPEKAARLDHLHTALYRGAEASLVAALFRPVRQKVAAGP